MKKLLSTILFLLMFLNAVIADAPASSEPVVIFSGTGNQVPAQVLEQLLQENADAVAIQITKWTPSVSNGVSTYDFIGPPVWYYISLTKSVTQRATTLDDRYIISCAKGVTKTLTTTFSHTVHSEISFSGSIGGEGYPLATTTELGIDGSNTVTIATTVQYTGPSEDSEANSREFRVRWYGDIGTWSGVLKYVASDETVVVTGNWIGVVGAVEYSIDRFITPE